MPRQNSASPTLSMTPKQKALLDFVCQFQIEKGYGPSQQEIARHFGYKSLGTVQNYLVRLQDQGALEKSWNSKRGIQVHPQFLKNFSQKPITESPSSPQSLSLFILGQVAAGRPLELSQANDPDTESVELPLTLFSKRAQLDEIVDDHFVLRVKGNSMIEDGILSGDLVIVRRQSNAENGETVVAMVNHEATIKRLQRGRKNSSTIELHAANPQFQPLVLDPVADPSLDFKIAGVMVGLVRRFYS